MLFLLCTFILAVLVCFLVYLYNLNNWNINIANVNLNQWVSSFECGFLGHSHAISNFSVTFLLFLVFFVVFDIEVSLLLNVPFQSPFFDNFYFYSIFLFYISFGFLAEIKSGFISWNS